MFAWEDGVVGAGRLPRETGSWGLTVVYRYSKDREELLVNDCGTFPQKEDLIMAEALGTTGMSCGTTINMGNYESARVDCWCSLPCTEESMAEQHQKCYDFVAAKVGEYAKSKILERKG